MKEIQELAEKVRSTLKIQYDDDGVQFIEGFIERQKARFPKEEWQGLINSCGAFLGQSVIENYGGKWVKEEDGHIAVVFDEKNAVFPFSKTKKQFENGLEDSIYSFYTTIPIMYKLQLKS